MESVFLLCCRGQSPYTMSLALSLTTYTVCWVFCQSNKKVTNSFHLLPYGWMLYFYIVANAVGFMHHHCQGHLSNTCEWFRVAIRGILGLSHNLWNWHYLWTFVISQDIIWHLATFTNSYSRPFHQCKKCTHAILYLVSRHLLKPFHRLSIEWRSWAEENGGNDQKNTILIS